MMADAVTITCKGVTYTGTYTVRDGVLTVASEYGTKVRPVLRASIPWLARHVLREIIAHARTWGKLKA